MAVIFLIRMRCDRCGKESAQYGTRVFASTGQPEKIPCGWRYGKRATIETHGNPELLCSDCHERTP